MVRTGHVLPARTEKFSATVETLIWFGTDDGEAAN